MVGVNSLGAKTVNEILGNQGEIKSESHKPCKKYTRLILIDVDV